MPELIQFIGGPLDGHRQEVSERKKPLPIVLHLEISRNTYRHITNRPLKPDEPTTSRATYELSTGNYRFVAAKKPAQKADNKISDLKLEDGTTIEPAQTYSLAITNYVYNGGNGVTAFKDAKVLMNPDEGTQDVNALIEYVTEKGEITPETELREYYIGQDIPAAIN